METFIAYIQEYWPTILEYALMFVAYFLVFLFRGKVNGTKNNLNLAFAQFRTEMTNTKNTLDLELTESKAQYRAAVDTIADLHAEITSLRQIVYALIDDTEVDDV